MLAVTLWYLASGNMFTDLQWGFRLAPNTISEVVREVCQAKTFHKKISVSDSNSNIIPIIKDLNPKFELILKLKFEFKLKLKYNTYSQVSIYLNSGLKSFILDILMDHLSLPLRSLKFLRLWL